MKKLLSLTALVALCAVAVAEDKLEVGSDVPAFYVSDVTGPAAGETLCYRCNYGSRPVVSVFARNVDGNVASLIKEIDGTVGQNQSKKMAAFVVLLSDEPEANQGKLKEVASKQQIKHTPLTVFDGAAGPGDYKIAKDAEVTVMMWVGSKLKVNQTMSAKELTSDKIATIVKETGKILN